ncbi:hypothetical protein T439DRAFT_376514 [Meredithblackwellia eburnea MCA 4105]
MVPSSVIALSLVALASAQHSSSSTHASVASKVVKAASSAATTTAKATVAAAAASGTPLPLTQYTYAYSQIPYQVNPYPYLRGPQSGYNECNSTTGGAQSECQTLIANNISDFCLWGAALDSPTGTIGEIEAATVAYCTKDTHGARTIPGGAITGVQFMRTKAYIQITGHIDQTALMLTKDDTGGELDPHGADLLGNPLGGLVYSTGLPSGNNQTYMQAVEWNNFIGGGVFCLKLCDPTVTSPNYCQNIFDLLGCSYNMPAAYRDNEFTSCEGDLQDVVGTYTSNGQTYTWSQPSSLPATSTLPWTPRIPSSSNCVTYQSSQLFSAASTTSSAVVSTSISTGANGKTSAVTITSSGSAASASASAKGSGATTSMVVSGGVLGLAFLGALFV